MSYQNFKISLLLISIAFIVFESIHFAFGQDDEEPSRLIALRSTFQKYEFVSPLLGCELEENTKIKEYEALKGDILRYLQKNKNLATDVSVYYRDLNEGKWLGINAEKKYAPASLFKVPIMIAYFKLAESNPGILEQTLVENQPSFDIIQNIKPTNQIEPFKYYSIEDLIYYMIVYSDNHAMDVLLANLKNDQYLKEVISDLGIHFEEVVDSQHPDFLTPKTYALLFRLLRNATFLNRAYSEKALELLAHVDFDQGIVAGIKNKALKVTNKFGERIDSDGKKEWNELHDCGIVYYPEKPYLLCIMTKGNSFKKQSKIIKNISSIVYDYTDDRQSKNLDESASSTEEPPEEDR